MKKVARALGQKGIAVSLPEAPAKSTSVFQASGLAPSRAFGSTIDAEGFRILFFVKPVSTYESKVFNIIVNDSRGIHSLDVFATYRGETSQLIKKLLDDKKSDFREIDTDCCAALVMEAAGLSRSRDAIVPATMSQFEAHFDDAINRKAAPEIYRYISMEQLGSLEPAPDTGALVDTMELAFWYIVTDAGKASWEKLSKLAAAEKAGDDEKFQEELRCCAGGELAAFFTDERRHAFKRRLEEFAAIFHSRGYPDQARAALFAAHGLAVPGHDPRQDPFCRAIIDRAFDIFQQTLKEQGRGNAAGSAAMGV
jgi:hypothetical protein